MAYRTNKNVLNEIFDHFAENENVDGAASVRLIFNEKLQNIPNSDTIEKEILNLLAVVPPRFANDVDKMYRLYSEDGLTLGQIINQEALPPYQRST